MEELTRLPLQDRDTLIISILDMEASEREASRCGRVLTVVGPDRLNDFSMRGEADIPRSQLVVMRTSLQD